MRKFLRNLLLALIPVAVINALCWGTLVFLAWQDDLTYVNYASALDKEKLLEMLSDNASSDVRTTVNVVVDSIASHVKEAEASDDLTILLIQYEPGTANS